MSKMKLSVVKSVMIHGLYEGNRNVLGIPIPPIILNNKPEIMKQVRNII